MFFLFFVTFSVVTFLVTFQWFIDNALKKAALNNRKSFLKISPTTITKIYGIES